MTTFVWVLPIVKTILALHVLLSLTYFFPSPQEHWYSPTILRQKPSEGHGLCLHSLTSAEKLAKQNIRVLISKIKGPLHATCSIMGVSAYIH